MGKLEGRKAIVLCGSSGIGLGIAEQLKAEDAQVAITGRDVEKLKEATRKLSLDSYESVDHGESLKTFDAVTKLVDIFQGLDILVIHAAPPPKGTFDLLKIGHWNEGFQKITLASVEAIQAALPALRKSKHPRIIFVLSTAAKEPIPGLLISSTLRAGMLGMMKSLARELAPDLIAVNAVLPGYTKTSDAVIASQSNLESLIPLKRLANPSEHGKFITFLASDDGAYITGQTLALDGGFIRGV